MTNAEVLDLPQGWLSDAEAEALSALARHCVVLEMGSYLGRSTVCMARVATHVVSVDHHRGSQEHQPGAANELVPDSLPEFVANLERYGVRSKVSACVMDIERAGRIFRPATFDLIYVDASHDFHSAKRDCEVALLLVRTGGVIAVHDWRPGNQVEGATKAVFPRLDAKGAIIGNNPQVVDSLAIFHV